MSEGFTYEFGESASRLETYEWDNIWWEKPGDISKKRVLIIGDSISCGYREFVNEIFGSEAYADGFGTSKALDNGAYEKALEYMASQYSDYAAVQFNNGLHGWHLSDEEYKLYYLKLVQLIKQLFPKARLIIALTTPARNREDPEEMSPRTERILARNRAAKEVALYMGAKLNDLYSVLIDRPDVYRDDGVHLKEQGYRLLADSCVERFKSYIK